MLLLLLLLLLFSLLRYRLRLLPAATACGYCLWLLLAATVVATVATAVATAVGTAVSQVFIPSVAVEYTSTHHADILCALGPMMNEVEWKAKGLDNYGLIAVNPDGNAAQVTTKTYTW